MNFGQTVLMGVITLVAGFFFGRLSSWLADRREIAKERLNNLYIPGMVLYDKTHFGHAYDFTDLSENDQEEFVKLLMEKSIYASDFLRECIYVASVNYYEYKLLPENKKAKEILNQSYNTVTEIMSDEWESLRNKLYWSKFDIFKSRKKMQHLKNRLIMMNSNDIYYIS